MAEHIPETLETERLFLIPPNEDAARDVFEYANDPIFCEHLDTNLVEDIDECSAFINKLIFDNNSQKRLYWMIALKESRKVIGTLGYIFSYPRHHKVVEFGYGLGVKYWGTGMFQEAAQAAINFGFSTLNLRKIQVLTRAKNIRSVNALKKLGFQQEGILVGFYESRDGREDCVIAGLQREMY